MLPYALGTVSGHGPITGRGLDDHGTAATRTNVRQYRYAATDDTVEALVHLRGAWAAYRVEADAFTVWLADGGEVRIAVERAEVEPDFEAFRLTAARTGEPDEDALATLAADDVSRASGRARQAPDFAVGRNDVVLFTGATWVEGPSDDVADEGGPVARATGRFALGPEQSVQFSGSPDQISETAAAVCLTTDALVVASRIGTGFLVRTGVQPYSVEVTDDAGAIARFLGERRYGTG
jgi:hypothetical protein